MLSCVFLVVSSVFCCFFRVFSLIFSRRHSMYFRFFVCEADKKKSVGVWGGEGSLKEVTCVHSSRERVIKMHMYIKKTN